MRKKLLSRDIDKLAEKVETLCQQYQLPSTGELRAVKKRLHSWYISAVINEGVRASNKQPISYEEITKDKKLFEKPIPFEEDLYEEA